jgi:hypothetical protein
LLTNINKMSLNNIQLHPHMLAGLYADVLMETDTNTIPDKQPPKHLGNHQKNITIIVNYPHLPFLPDQDLNFLTNILNACRLSLADIAIINFYQSGGITEKELRDLSSKQVLLFGLDPTSIGLPVNFPQYQIQPFNKINYLHAPSLSELEKDKSLKQKLWLSLKTMFEL